MGKSFEAAQSELEQAAFKAKKGPDGTLLIAGKCAGHCLVAAEAAGLPKGSVHV